MFKVYLQLGFDHIADIKGYDHILFIIALCAAYTATQWKQVLILVTAFTIGHTTTLALAALRIIHLPPGLIEVLIPVTILLTAARNLRKNPPEARTWRTSYAWPLVFGLIHGLGFSNYFKSLLGQEADIVLPLFAFNVGVELGQIGIVIVILLVNGIALSGLRLSQKKWTLGISLSAALLSAWMIVQRIMILFS